MGGAPIAQQGGAGGGGFGGGPDEIGNDGLTTIQRKVLAVFEQPAHLASSEGITVEQVRLPLGVMRHAADTSTPPFLQARGLFPWQIV
jgi:hypothetical protein